MTTLNLVIQAVEFRLILLGERESREKNALKNRPAKIRYNQPPIP